MGEIGNIGVGTRDARVILHNNCVLDLNVSERPYVVVVWCALDKNDKHTNIIIITIIII